MFDHTFRWPGKTIRLIYSVSEGHAGRRLVLEDVRATSAETANSVPDWKIESEASAVASDHAARYL